MLQKVDLEVLEKLLDKVEERLGKRVENSALELHKEIISLRTEMKKEFKRVHGDQNLLVLTLPRLFGQNNHLHFLPVHPEA